MRHIVSCHDSNVEATIHSVEDQIAKATTTIVETSGHPFMRGLTLSVSDDANVFLGDSQQRIRKLLSAIKAAKREADKASWGSTVPTETLGRSIEYATPIKQYANAPVSSYMFTHTAMEPDDDDWATTYVEYLSLSAALLATEESLKLEHPDVAERLSHLFTLPPNWDGYGASVISATAVNACTRLILSIEPTLYSKAGAPFIAPMADGGIELEWDCVRTKELMLTIPPIGRPVLFLLTPCDDTDSSAELSGDLPDGDDAVSILLTSAL